MTARCYFALAFFCMILGGCMFRPVTVSTRHFTLAAIPASESRASASSKADNLSLGIGFIKMPSYVLRNPIAIRNGSNEIEYLENALWSERLDESFQRVLAVNLGNLLPSDRIYLNDWTRGQVMLGVHITVEQFDVDTHGHGTLVALWRITTPGAEVPLKSGRTLLEQHGTLGPSKPEMIAKTLSDLEARFSRELAQSIHEAKQQ